MGIVEAALIDQLPPIPTNDLRAPDELVSRGECPFGDHWPNIESVDGKRLLQRSAGQIDQGRIQVDD